MATEIESLYKGYLKDKEKLYSLMNKGSIPPSEDEVKDVLVLLYLKQLEWLVNNVRYGR